MVETKASASSPAAIVIGLDCITGLQTARILARWGVPVIAIASNRGHYCCKTRVCEEVLEASTSTPEFVAELLKLGPRMAEKPVLFPCTDMSVLIISRNREKLSQWFHISLPDHGVVEMLMNKISFFEHAEKVGLAIPETFLIHDRSEAEHAASNLAYPCIVKPPLKSPKWAENTTAKVYKVSDAEEFLKLYDKIRSWAEVLMAQEWVEGTDADLYSCNCYFDDQSEPLVSFIARKIRQWPPETGTSCLGEEVRNDEVLQESLDLFRGVNYRGLGYVEMKRDTRTGKHYVIEPNIGRPTGRSAIAEGGGVELVYTMYCDCVGRPLPKNRQQTYGNVKWIYWRRDLQSAFYYWRRNRLTLRDWLRSWRGRKVAAVFSWSDPGPFVSDLLRSVRLAMTSTRKTKKTRQVKDQ